MCWALQGSQSREGLVQGTWPLEKASHTPEALCSWAGLTRVTQPICPEQPSLPHS